MLRLPKVKQDQVVNRFSILSKKAIEILKYEKNNEGYWDRVKLVKEVKKKAFPIVKAIYPRYSHLFLFDNITSHLVYTEDAIQIKNMSKKPGSKQVFLRDGWYF